MQRILIVDDYEAVLESMRRLFRDTEYEVVVVNDREALLVLERGESFDLIISDVDMIVIRGEELIKRFKAKHPAMRALLTSGGKRPECDEADGFFEKPFDFEALRDLVRNTLNA